MGGWFTKESEPDPDQTFSYSSGGGSVTSHRSEENRERVMGPYSEDLPDQLTPKDCMKFIPPVKFCRVIKVYDGDTITIATRFPEFHPTNIYKFQVRLNGLDAPEIKGKDTEEKLAAINSRDKLSKKILNKEVELREVGFEKYGRQLCEVWHDGVNINKWLIKNRLAVEYDGGTKNAEIKWGEFQNPNGKKAVNYEKLVRTSTKDFSGKKRIKKEKKTPQTARVPVEKQKKLAKETAIKMKNTYRPSGKKQVQSKKLSMGEDSDEDFLVDEGESGEEIMYDSDEYSGPVENNRNSGYQTRRRNH